PLEFARGKGALFGMHRRACAPIEGDQLAHTPGELLAQERQGAANLPHRLAIVASQRGYRLVVGAERLQQPQPYDIAVRFLLPAGAGAQAIEIPIKGELPELARMRRRASGGRRCDAVATARCKIECIDEGVEKADRILGRDVVVEALWNEEHLVPGRALDMPHHRMLRERGSQSDMLYYCKSWGFDTVWCDVRRDPGEPCSSAPQPHGSWSLTCWEHLFRFHWYIAWLHAWTPHSRLAHRYDGHRAPQPH